MKTIDFIKTNSNWEETLSQPPYCLTIRKDNNYALLKYNQIESDFCEPIVKECRGLIVDLVTLEPVALSFYKFFNVQEQYADKIYWKDCRVQEKVDGSKILVWFDKYHHIWRISTSGNLDAKNASVNDFGLTFEELFYEAIKNNGFEYSCDFFQLLDTDYCYTFELVSPYSKVVIPYKETKLYLIGIRSVINFEEINPNTQAISIAIARPKEYQLNSLKACLEATEKMGYDEEGFVVVDKYWNRVKIKSPAYVIAHHLKNNGSVNKEKVIEIIERGEKEEFLGYFPEYERYFDEIEPKREQFLEDLHNAVVDIQAKKEEMCFSTRKDFAKYIVDNYKNISRFLFNFIDTDLLQLFIETQWNKLDLSKKAEYIYKEGQ